MELFISIFAGLFSIINPLGTVPIYVGLTSNDTKLQQRRTAILASINVLVILLISYFIGNAILNFFGISINSLRLAGGLIIASSGFSLLTGSFTKHKGMKRKSVQEDLEKRSEISLTPLAIPMLAGPGSISFLIGIKQTHVGKHEMISILVAIFAVCIAVFFILHSSQLIVKGLGASGINAVSRIIGFIVIAIGIEYVTKAILEIVAQMAIF